MQHIHQGGCHCGQLRYRFNAPLQSIAHCHCSICRRTSGGIVTSWLTVLLTTQATNCCVRLGQHQPAAGLVQFAQAFAEGAKVGFGRFQLQHLGRTQ